MKQTVFYAAVALAILVTGCGRDYSKPNKVYMPDMAYSRAVETYSSVENLHAQGINYNATPVAGTIKRGELFPFSLSKDKAGDSANYILSKQVKNPLPALTPAQTTEAERIYLVNCGICHGQKLDGNGPLYADGKGPYAAAPRNLISDPVVVNMPEGQMFYSITYGKNMMGGYGTQLSTTQRWMIIQFIKNKQNPGKAAAPAADSAVAAK